MAGSTKVLAAVLLVDLAIGAMQSRPSVHSSCRRLSFLPAFSFSPFLTRVPAPPPLFSLFAVPALQARLETDARQEWTYCVYRTDAATALGGTTLALLLVGQAVAPISSRCFCCGSALRPGGAQACALVLFLSSWYH